MPLRISVHRSCVLMIICGLWTAGHSQAGPSKTPTQLTMEALGYYQSHGAGKNYTLAYKLFSQASAAGSKTAEAWLGSMYLHGQGVPQDIAKATSLIQDAANSNDGVGLRMLGVLYQNGTGVPRDYVQAKAAFEKAITAGDVNSYPRLSLLYSKGLGTPQNRTEAIALLQQGASKGDRWAESLLAQTLETRAAAGTLSLSTTQSMAPLTADPDNTVGDLRSAVQLYTTASEKGSLVATFKLGRLYETGKGVTQDYGRAYSLYHSAAVQGFTPAQLALAHLCEKGLGTPEDDIDAYVFYALPAQKGSAAGLQGMQVVSHKMTTDQRQSATAILQAVNAKRLASQSRP